MLFRPGMCGCVGGVRASHEHKVTLRQRLPLSLCVYVYACACVRACVCVPAVIGLGCCLEQG